MPLENELFENLLNFKNNEATNDLLLKKEMINNLKEQSEKYAFQF
jgi:hypothetical protein